MAPSYVRASALLQLPLALAAAAASPPPAPVLDVERTKLSIEQFEKLPDGQVLEFRGERITVHELKAKMAEARARRAAEIASARARFEDVRSRVLAEQHSKIEAQNTGAAAVLFQAKQAPPPLHRPLPGAPQLDKCSPSTMPGSSIVCYGKGFGPAPGKVELVGVKKYDGAPLSGAAVELSTSASTWADGGCVAGVPSNLVGFETQQAGVRVTNKSGPSNVVYVTLEPLLDVLPAGADAVEVTCAGRWDTCRYLGALSGLWDASHTTSGFVANGDKGTDVYKANLKHGWRFVVDANNYPKVDFHPDSQNAQQTGPPDVAWGKALHVSVPWHYGWGFGGAGTGYLIGFLITGPRGVPWK